MTVANIKVAGIIEFPIYRMGITGVLNKIPGIDYVGNTDWTNISRFLNECPVDVLLVSAKRESAFKKSLFQKLRSSFKELKIVFFLNTVDVEEIRQYRGFAFNGFLLKSLSIPELEYALHTIHRKGFYISQGVSEDMIDDLLSNEYSNKDLIMQNLTKREQQIMMMIYQEYTTHEIAEKLKISRRTVEVHRVNIIRKTGVRNNIGIVKFIAKFDG